MVEFIFSLLLTLLLPLLVVMSVVLDSLLHPLLAEVSGLLATFGLGGLIIIKALCL